jgi:TPR repeat protein
LCDYSLEGYSDQIAGEIAWVRSLSLDIESVEAMVLENVFIEQMARLKVLEANASVGVEAASAPIPYDSLEREDAQALSDLKALCAQRGEEAFNSLRESIGKGFAGEDAAAEAKIASAYARCLVYGFGVERNLEKALVSADSFSFLEEGAESSGKLFKGLKYYIDCRIAADCGAKMPSPRGYGCGGGNPWRIIAQHEHDRIAGGNFAFYSSKWRIGKAVSSSVFESLDTHAQNRLRFIYALESFKFNGEWKEDISLGLLGGVKEDQDLAVWAIMEAGKRLEYHKEFKIASLLGYFGVSSLISYIDSNAPISGIKFDRFSASARSDICAYHYAEYIFNEGKHEAAFAWMRKCAESGYKPAQIFLAHMLKAHGGDHEEALHWLKKHADSDGQSKLELFFELKEDPKQVKAAEDLAIELCESHGKVAYWLGQRRFSQKRYPEALEALNLGHRLEDASSIALLSFCHLHGYGTKENLDLGLALLREAEEKDADASLPRMLLEASKIGAKVPLGILKKQFQELKNALEESSPDQAHFANAIFNMQMLASLGPNARFWKTIKKFNSRTAGFRSINAAGQNNCFFPLITFCGASIASQWSRKGAYLVEMAIEDLAFSASCGNKLAAVLGDFIASESKRAERLNMPSSFQRIGQALKPLKRDQALAQTVAEIEKSVNEELFPALLDLYIESCADFNALRMIVPWMDDAFKTLEGMRLSRLCALRLEAGDTNRARDLLIRSANCGDGQAAFEMFQSLDKTSEDALYYLDIALKCNIAEAFANLAALVEDGMKDRGSAPKIALKAIWKGSLDALSRMRGMKLGAAGKLWLSKAKFAAQAMNLKEGD